MFDVDWSDPARESVGDRRTRKDKAFKGKGKDEKGDDDTSLDDDQDYKTDNQDRDQDSKRYSDSVRSSVSSIEKQFGFFGGKQRKKGGPSSRLAKSKSVAGSPLRTSTIEEQPQGNSASAASLNSRRTGTAGADGDPGLPSRRLSSFADSVFGKLDDNDRPPGGSMLGCDITNPQPGSATLFQELGDGVSMITKTTVTSVRDIRTDEDSSFLVSRAYISAGDSDHYESANLISSKDESPQGSPDKSIRRVPTHFHEVVQFPPNNMSQAGGKASAKPKTPTADESRQLPAIAESSTATTGDFSRQQSKQLPRPKLSAPAISPASLRPTENPEAWKAPGDWAISPIESTTSGQTAEGPFELPAFNQVSDLTLDLTRMQAEVDRMVEASPQVILRRLKEDPMAVNQQVADGQHDEASRAIGTSLVCKERQMEKTRLLLSALYNMETMWDPRDKMSKPVAHPDFEKVISLFESQAIASYLAATNNTIPVYHMAAKPLDHKQYPNVHPVVTPTVSSVAITHAAESFSSVSCVPIISLFPSSEVPRLLQKINYILAPGGYLHLFIIDPWPISTSMGPKLQHWLDEHLVFNLELHFRNSHPSRVFPVWLEEAGLRAPGSIVTHTRFIAVSDHSGPTGSTRGSADEEAAITKELRTTVGRLLWQEIWAPFVTGDKWWWDVPEIVDECMERKTYWEYKIIAACKAPNQSESD